MSAPSMRRWRFSRLRAPAPPWAGGKRGSGPNPGQIQPQAHDSADAGGISGQREETLKLLTVSDPRWTVWSEAVGECEECARLPSEDSYCPQHDPDTYCPEHADCPADCPSHAANRGYGGPAIGWGQLEPADVGGYGAADHLG